jgi:hypothetical protein
MIGLSVSLIHLIIKFLFPSRESIALWYRDISFFRCSLSPHITGASHFYWCPKSSLPPPSATSSAKAVVNNFLLLIHSFPSDVRLDGTEYFISVVMSRLPSLKDLLDPWRLGCPFRESKSNLSVCAVGQKVRWHEWWNCHIYLPTVMIWVILNYFASIWISDTQIKKKTQTTRPQRRSTFFYITYINSVRTSQETIHLRYIARNSDH